ncbi:MAG: PE-PPE domain-containing protein, partial [Mycobacterium sp.]
MAPGGIAAAALAVSGFSPGAAPSPSETPSPSVGLAALITPANSTAQIFAGTTYYGTDYANPPTYGPQQVVPFYQGPGGIADAIVAHKADK